MPGMLWADFVPGTMAHAQHRVDRYGRRPRDAGRARRADRPRYRRALFRPPVVRLAGARDRPRALHRRVRRRGRGRNAADRRGRHRRDHGRVRRTAGSLRYRSRAARRTPSSCTSIPKSIRSCFRSGRSIRTRTSKATATTTIGDVDAGFAQADRIFEHTFTTPRYHGGYLEPRATMVWIDDGRHRARDLDQQVAVRLARTARGHDRLAARTVRRSSELHRRRFRRQRALGRRVPLLLSWPRRPDVR